MIDKNTDLGVRARDMVTGFEGIITGRAEYLNGCTQFVLTPPVDEDGKSQKGQWIDNGQLEFVDLGVADQIPGPVAAATPVAAKSPGGPQRDAPPL